MRVWVYYWLFRCKNSCIPLGIPNYWSSYKRWRWCNHCCQGKNARCITAFTHQSSWCIDIIGLFRECWAFGSFSGGVTAHTSICQYSVRICRECQAAKQCYIWEKGMCFSWHTCMKVCSFLYQREQHGQQPNSVHSCRCKGSMGINGRGLRESYQNASSNIWWILVRMNWTLPCPFAGKHFSHTHSPALIPTPFSRFSHQSLSVPTSRQNRLRLRRCRKRVSIWLS